MAAVTALLKAKHKPVENKAVKASSSLTQGQLLQASYTAHAYSTNAQQQAAGGMLAQANTMASNGSKVLPPQQLSSAKGTKEEGEQQLTQESFSMLEDGGCA